MFTTAPVLTDMGKTLLLRAAAGEKITFTKFQAGSGSLGTGETQEGATALKNAVLSSISIASATVDAAQGKMELRGTFSNQSLQAAFAWRELGLFAKDESNVEYLYAYGNSGAAAGVVPAANADILTEETISIEVVIGDSGNLLVVIDPNASFALQADLDAHINDTGKPVNLRASMSTNSRVICQVPVGKQVRVTEEHDKWARCTYQADTTGYMLREFLREPGTAPVNDTVTMNRAKLQEIRACLADSLAVVNQALGLKG